MKITCPECQTQFPLSAGLLDADAKRFGAAMGAVEPALARALVGYLGLHKPAKTVLRITRATKLVEEINALVATGEVRRNGVSRPATVAMWTSAIDMMLDQRNKLRLPLSGHGYLLEIVAGLADKADAIAERKVEADRRSGRHLDASADAAAADAAATQRMALAEALGRLQADFTLGLINRETLDARVAELRTRRQERRA